MVKVNFYELGSVRDDYLKFAVIVSQYEGRWVYCQHVSRDTWEIPGGKREVGETILETAHRELLEETGATEYALNPVCVYSVEGEVRSFGLLCYAEIRRFGAELEGEIARIALLEGMPEALTYPEIQPQLFERVLMDGGIVFSP